MDLFLKLALAAGDTQFEADGIHNPVPARPPTELKCGLTNRQIRDLYNGRSPDRIVHANGNSIPIYMAAVPGGRRLPLLKVMLTTACERNCYYCPFQAGRDHHRVTFDPDELAQVVVRAHRAGWIQGVFISTGIINGGANTQNKILDTAEILRNRLNYSGYLHMKIMPGAEHGQVLRSMQLADRVSTNLEAPNPARLNALAPQKDFNRELLNPLRWADQIRHNIPARRGWNGRWPSISTQFVVGAAGENDVEMLSTVEHLYRRLHLKRVYFEAFSPVIGTPMESHPAEKPLRQQRLYEASFLLRDYGFTLEEIPFMANGCLPLNVDPKRAYADRVLREDPVDLNCADRRLLLRVPGIGPKSADKLLNLRRQGRLRDISQLRRQRLISDRSAPYIIVRGNRPSYQQRLFDYNHDALSK